MADRWAVQNGAWSNTATWDGGILPTIDDDVFADNRTVTIDTDIIVKSLRTTQRTGGTAGGGFRPNNNTVIRASLLAGTTSVINFLSATPNSCTIYGNLTGSTTDVGTTTVYLINNNSTGTINLTSDFCRCVNNMIFNNGTGTANLLLNRFINIDTGTIPNIGVITNSTGMLNITGNFVPGAGTGFNDFGGMIVGSSTGTINFSGSIIGGINTLKGVGLFGGAIFNGVGVFRGGGSASADRTGAIETRGNATISLTGTIIGDTTGTASGGPGLVQIGAGTVNLTVSGSIIGGNGSNPGGNAGVKQFSTAGAVLNMIVYGNIQGGTLAGNYGVMLQNSTGNITLCGDVYGGRGANVGIGIQNSSTGNVNVIGNAYGANNVAVNNISNGVVYIRRVVGAPGGPLGSGGTAVGLANSQNGLAYVEEVEFGEQGATPISGPVFILSASNNIFSMRKNEIDITTGKYQRVPFFNSFSIEGIFPLPRDVRKGVVYALGDYTGTMAVPSPSAVQFDVPVDDTRGLLFLRPENFWEIPRSAITDPATIGYRLKNVATTGAAGQLIASFNLDTLSGYNDPISLPLKPQYIYYRNQDEIENFKWRTAYIAVSSGTSKFSVLVNGLSDIDFYNYFDSNNYNNCYWTLTTTPALSTNRTIIRPTETATISGINNKTYTLYYYTTGTMVGGLSAAIGGISTSDLLLPGITTTPQ
jgi:hypothetical protein